MAIIPSLPVTLQNGTTADATQVMANFNAIVNGVNAGAANAGINTNISQLLGLTIALSPSQGGTGQQILTPNGVLIGEGIGPVNAIAPGNSGTVLTSNGAGSDPSYQPLNLGTMATQNANAVAITGGTISGTTITGHASADLQASNNLSDLGSLTSALSNLTFAGAASGNGYFKVPNSANPNQPFIVQWAAGSGSGNINGEDNASQTINFPIVFPNNCFKVFASMQAANAVLLSATLIGTPSTSNCVINVSNQSSIGPYAGTPFIVAIGN